ncbi:uncharacterized protein LOC120626724 isoform X2 [Pararge aegeria]|nr:uncharacterized protein LOC120626724 isoform X2 [Pararge aegeria]XP_039750315.1 uncharacterized protein LOC120626724 isoform X2 [Pararge aegeria]XP_039750316.1 uncharacterized protein LOC120626724 isoform X2 [Pararge aegeria]
MWSTALDVLLTTLRYIAPATILTLFWGQQSFLFKLLKYIDSAVRSLVFSNEEQKQNVLQWLGDAGPVRVDKLEVVWRHGWILCGVLDAALPGACAGHPPTRLSLKHAQSIADNYLGVDPVFSRRELESNDSLSRHQEWKFINYLENIRLCLSKLTPPPKSINSPIQKETEEVSHFTLDYIARGSGLVATQLNHKVYFKIYPTAQQSLDPGEINILIHGPKDTYGIAVLPPILGKAQLIRQNLLGLQSKTSYTENVLPITQGTTYLRSYGSNDINKTFYIPKTKYDIDIDIEIKEDHAKVGYVASLEGKYEISITSRGQNVVGSPFKVKASNNIVGDLEGDSFCLEDGEEIDIVDVKTDRKVVLRIVDFVTEKMLLNENGTFEKISDEEARYLMQTENVNVPNKNTEYILKRHNTEVKSKSESSKFYHLAKKVVTLCRICKIFQNRKHKKVLFKTNARYNKDSPEKQNIPDILNSTIYDSQLKSHTLLKNKNRVIVPENISVALLTKMPKTFVKEKSIETSDTNIHSHMDSLENYNTLKVDRFEDDSMSVDTVQSSINPFVDDIYNQSYAVDKLVKSIIPKEFETHNSQNEETENITEQLYVDRQVEMKNLNINPFIDGNDLERPKTPVYKIISGEVTNRTDSVYIDPEQALSTDESACNSFTNPFLKHETEIGGTYQERPDFIIGAPVSLVPVNFVSSTKTNTDRGSCKEKKKKTSEGNKSTSLHCGIGFSTKHTDGEIKDQNDDNFSSLDSNLTQDIIIISRGSPTPTTPNQSQTSREMSPKKDTWDSAYVSIDDNNCLSENNINELINESFNKRKSPLSGDMSKMGPAEREIWQCDSELKDIAYNEEDYRLYKHDLRRPEFTPIIEENEKIITSDMKDMYGNNTDSESVAATFSELNDIYDDDTNSENNSATTTQDNRLQNLGIDYALQGNDIHVDSASDVLSDVKRHAKKFEGKISEVQATESLSVSPSLHVKSNEHYQEQNNNDEIQFGDRIYSNIVLEKKKYWDDKIRQIEEKSEEIILFQNKRRFTSKYLRRNDSIAKRKGKKIVQHILKSGHEDYETYTKSNTETSDFRKSKGYIENMKNLNISDDKPIGSNKYSLNTCFERKKSSVKIESTIGRLFAKNLRESSTKFADDNISEGTKHISNSNVESKQEVSEKVFQAFETSPKRFFGTSRKHILNKIDTFLASNDDEKESGKDTSDVNYESGLVSSRISLFHNISQTEESPCPQMKSKSMHNIPHQSAETRLSSDRLNRDSKDEVDKNSKGSERNLNCSNQLQESPTSLKEKRARLIQSANNKSFDDTLFSKNSNTENSNDYVKKTIKGFSKQYDSQFQSSTSKLKSISKSEMDIFNKKTIKLMHEDLDKHKSYEELPKVSVKNFISLYEDVSKTSNNKTSQSKMIQNVKSAGSSNNQVPISPQGTTSTIKSSTTATPAIHSTLITTSQLENPDSTTKTLSQDGIRISNDKCINLIGSLNNKALSTEDKEGKYLSLSDIDLEIIEDDQEIKESSSKRETAHLDYKNRFSKAKEFFQSLEELRGEKRLKKYGLFNFENNNSIESLEEYKRSKKSNIKKSHSMPSSEIAKAWNQLQEQKEERKLVKISEKFNVDDLFEDVMEGRLSRQGSLRGIPHKKAVLETFKSMENLTDSNLNSYEMAESQLHEFAKDNKIRNAQTYLTEYPYLPTTDPSKYHSRLDVNATGLITFKELKKIPRRNSVPDLRLNTSFTADL